MENENSAPQSKSTTCFILGSTHKHPCHVTSTVSHTNGELVLYPDDRCHLIIGHFVLGILGVHVMLAHNLLWIQNEYDYVALEFRSEDEASEWASFVTYPIFAAPPVQTPDKSEVNERPSKLLSTSATSYPSPVFLRNTLSLHRHAAKPQPPLSSPSVELLGLSAAECHRIQVEKLVITERLKQQKRRHERQELASLVAVKWNELQKRRLQEAASMLAHYKAVQAAAPDLLHQQLLTRLRQVAPPSTYHYRVGMAVAALIVQRLWRGFRIRSSLHSLQRLQRLQQQMHELQNKTEALQKDMMASQLSPVRVLEHSAHSIVILPPLQPTPPKTRATASNLHFTIASSTSSEMPKYDEYYTQPKSSEAHKPIKENREADAISTSIVTNASADMSRESSLPPSRQQRYSISIEPEPVEDTDIFDNNSGEEMKEEMYSNVPPILHRQISTEEGSPVSILMEYLQRKGKPVPHLPKRSVESPNRLHRRLSRQSTESPAVVINAPDDD